MQEIVKHIVADLSGYRLSVVDVSQGDRRSRVVRCRLLENGKPWNIPEGARVLVSYQLPDGTPGSYDTMPDGSPAGQVEGHTVTAKLSDQLTISAGAVAMSIVLLGADGEQLSVWPLRLNVIGPQKLTTPENLPALGAGFEGKLLFGGKGGVMKPLELGDGLYLEGDALHAAGGGGGSSGPAYVASDEPPQNTRALWVDTSEPEEAVALGVTAVKTVEGVDLYCTDELGTVKESLRHGKDGEPGATPVKGVDYFDGAPGKNGTTPRIGDNGNWWLGGTDTGKPSRGEQGPKYELTDADKQEITGAVLDALPKWTGGAY